MSAGARLLSARFSGRKSVCLTRVSFDQLRYWAFFVTVDEDLHELSRFVEIHPRNLKTFSVQLVRLYLPIGSEIDVVAKLLCREIDATQEPDRITKYRPIILGKYPKTRRFEHPRTRH